MIRRYTGIRSGAERREVGYVWSPGLAIVWVCSSLSDHQVRRQYPAPSRFWRDRGKVYVNASSLGEHSQLRIGLVDEGFHSIPGYSGEDAVVIAEDGLRVPVHWKGGDSLLSSQGLIRLDVQFTGIRPEDCLLHAVYIGE